MVREEGVEEQADEGEHTETLNGMMLLMVMQKGSGERQELMHAKAASGNDEGQWTLGR